MRSGCSWSGVGLVFPKPLSPKHRSTFLPIQHAPTLIFSADWGLGSPWGSLFLIWAHYVENVPQQYIVWLPFR